MIPSHWNTRRENHTTILQHNWLHDIPFITCSDIPHEKMVVWCFENVCHISSYRRERYSHVTPLNRAMNPCNCNERQAECFQLVFIIAQIDYSLAKPSTINPKGASRWLSNPKFECLHCLANNNHIHEITIKKSL